MSGMAILIVDDEQPARKKIRTFLKDEGEVAVIFEAGNGVEAARLIQEKNPDLVLLDIQMPGMTGFEVMEAVGVEKMPAVIFVTAYDQYALAAFEVHALDYLLKPFDQERFRKSFRRAIAQIHLQKQPTGVLQRLLAEIKPEQKYLQRLMVPAGGRYFFVKTGEVQFISAEEKYVEIHTHKGGYLLRETMNEMEQRLDPAKFARIHRSYLVNIDFIAEVQPASHGDCIAVLKNGVKLAVSRRYRGRLLGRDEMRGE